MARLHTQPPPQEQVSPRDAETRAMLGIGNPEGLRRLVADHGAAVSARLRRTFREALSENDIEEVLARALTNAWRTAPRYDGSGTLRAWLAVIAHNCAFNVLRERRRNPLLYLGSLDQHGDPVHGQADRQRLLLDVQQCLLELPALQRAILRADIEAGGMASTEELADLHGRTTDSIYSARKRGRRQLCELLEQLGHRVKRRNPDRSQPGTKGKRKNGGRR